MIRLPPPAVSAIYSDRADARGLTSGRKKLIMRLHPGHQRSSYRLELLPSSRILQEAEPTLPNRAGLRNVGVVQCVLMLFPAQLV